MILVSTDLQVSPRGYYLSSIGVDVEVNNLDKNMQIKKRQSHF